MCVCHLSVCVCQCVCVCVCVVSVIVKRPVLPPSVVDGRSRNPLYYYYYYLRKKVIYNVYIIIYVYINTYYVSSI